MTEAPSQAIALPRWYAALNAGADRLAVFSPHEGCEMATFGDAGSVVLFDGYLFDQRLLTSQLQAPANAAPANLVAAAYQQWGAEGVFDKFDGSYIAAIWDASKRRLFLGHDPFGHHPVYFSHDGTRVSFSSNVLALSSARLIPTTPNRLSLALSMLFYWPDAGQTFFEQIQRLRPKTFLEISEELTIAVHRYGRKPPEDDEPYLTEREVLAEFEPALLRAVDRCMELSPEGIMLSGGVDSVVIAALAHRSLRSHAMPALVAVSGRSADLPASHEDEMQTKVTDALGMRHVIFKDRELLSGMDGLAASLALTPELPGPPDMYWIGGYVAFCRDVARQNLHVLLTGSGGDDWLSVGNKYAADLIRRFQFRTLYRFIKASSGTGSALRSEAIRKWVWTGGLRPLLDMAWARLAPLRKDRYHRKKWQTALPAWLCPEPSVREEFIDHLMQRRTPSLTAEGRVPRNYYRHSMRTMVNPYLSYEFETAHHVQRLCGLRLLSPYHDTDLVYFFSRIPPHVLIHGDRYKGLLRPLAGRLLPGFGLEDQRKAYTPESQTFMREELRKSVLKRWPDGGFSRLDRLGVVDSRVAEKEIDGTTAGLTDLNRMFALLAAERWLADHTSV